MTDINRYGFKLTLNQGIVLWVRSVAFQDGAVVKLKLHQNTISFKTQAPRAVACTTHLDAIKTYLAGILKKVEIVNLRKKRTILPQSVFALTITREDALHLAPAHALHHTWGEAYRDALSWMRARLRNHDGAGPGRIEEQDNMLVVLDEWESQPSRTSSEFHTLTKKYRNLIGQIVHIQPIALDKDFLKRIMHRREYSS